MGPETDDISMGEVAVTLWDDWHKAVFTLTNSKVPSGAGLRGRSVGGIDAADGHDLMCDVAFKDVIVFKSQHAHSGRVRARLRKASFFLYVEIVHLISLAVAGGAAS